MGLSRKASKLFENSPDIAVVQECSRKDTDSPPSDRYKGVWFGTNPAKGLGVFATEEWQLRPLGHPQHEWVAAVEIDGPECFTLIAVWACAVKGNRQQSYVGVIHRSLAAHPEWFERGPVVMAGDFNSNSIFDKNRPIYNHTALVRQLRQHGLVSAYHTLFKERQGRESRPTFHLYRKTEKTFHLDYIFLPRAWARRLNHLELGGYDDWSCLSDHCPLTVEVRGRRQGGR